MHSFTAQLKDKVCFVEPPRCSASTKRLPGQGKAPTPHYKSYMLQLKYVVNGEVNYTDALIASWIGAATSNTGLVGTLGWNAASGATSNYIKGDEPLSGAIISGSAASVGYGLGKVIQGPIDKLINPNWKNWEWVDVGMGISKPMPLDPRPAVIDNIISSDTTEGVGQSGTKNSASPNEEGK